MRDTSFIDEALLRTDASLISLGGVSDEFIAVLVSTHVSRIHALIGSMTTGGGAIVQALVSKDLSRDK